MKTSDFYVAPPREFPLSFRATFDRELQSFTHKFTPLSMNCFVRHFHGKLEGRESKPLPLALPRLAAVIEFRRFPPSHWKEGEEEKEQTLRIRK